MINSLQRALVSPYQVNQVVYSRGLSLKICIISLELQNPHLQAKGPKSRNLNFGAVQPSIYGSERIIALLVRFSFT